ncbi:helix-turn-helix domain-containing protein [Candidatus Enterococcus ferrettii]|uniref:Mga helix-turn-helix domain-containing protein n=1 Tax=Candidatus Enterococcus ferrettii TaxID=2815324 RepID=A0ABV0EMN8_9ENTE|nr:helix-turn-helix domain-containing protein [Enterococcus sp. 665A]MBO1339657.1 helix-turn-helix domain-containing protein [Enterococcus sp. 665A]
MKKFLDVSVRRKVAILTLLNDREKVTIDELSQLLQVARGTVLHSIESIQEDFNDWQLKEPAIIKERADVYLQAKENFSLHRILLNYLDESVQYQAMVVLFHNGEIRLKDFAERQFISYNSLYKKIQALNPTLQAFDLNFSTNSSGQLYGSEHQIRFFYSEFFWHSSSGVSWPFPKVNKKIIERSIKYVEKVRGRQLGIVEKQKVANDLGVIITRIMQKNYVDPVILEHEMLQDSWHFQQLYKKIKPLFQLFFRINDQTQIKAELAYAYLFLFSQEYHLSDNNNIGDMLFYCQTHQLRAGTLTNQWLSEFYKQFSVYPSAKDYGLLYANLVHKHVKALTFHGAGVLMEMDLSAALFTNSSFDYKVQQMFDELAAKEPSLLKNKTFLLMSYKFLISQYIEVERENQQISVCILSVFGDEYIEVIKRNLTQQLAVELVVTNTVGKDTCLVIADRIYENMNFDSDKILYWEIFPTKKSMQRVQLYINHHFG